jgi:hypothetical protein
MKNKNPIEVAQRKAKDEEYFEKKYREARIIIQEKDKIIENLKKNLDNF